MLIELKYHVKSFILNVALTLYMFVVRNKTYLIIFKRILCFEY